jgi:hypothetical protein
VQACARPAVSGQEVAVGKSQTQAHRQGPLRHCSAAIAGAHSAAIDAVERASGFHGYGQTGFEDRMELRIGCLAADEPDSTGAVAAECDGIISQAHGQLFAQLFGDGASGIKDGLANRVAAFGLASLAAFQQALAEGFGFFEGDA